MMLASLLTLRYDSAYIFSREIPGFIRFIYNKRPIGYIAHLRKQFKSLNTYFYVIIMIKRRNKQLLTLWQFIGSSFEQTWILFIQGCFLPSLIEIGSVVLEKKMKMWKVYANNNDNDNDNGQIWSEKLTWAFGSGELKIRENVLNRETQWFRREI